MRWMGRLMVCAALVGASACVHFDPVEVPAPQPGEARSVGWARVTTTESRFYQLRDVRITADSVVGWEEARSLDPSARQRIAIHRSDIRRFEERRLNAAHTVLLGGAFAALLAFLHDMRDY
ncbi:MAG TPA: hypothetical protein VF142_14570 [Longimicrobium sp.]